jgi:hypothetical protein
MIAAAWDIATSWPWTMVTVPTAFVVLCWLVAEWREARRFR